MTRGAVRARWATLLLPLALVAASPRRALALDPGRAISQYLLDVWTTKQGAPAGTIRQITQTPDGFLWLATDSEGLVRFDGARFVRIDALDRLFDRSDYSVFSAYTARDGVLWVGTQWGLARLAEQEWRGPLVRGEIGGLHETDDGLLHFVVGFHGVGWLDRQGVHTLPSPQGCISAAPDTAGRSWFGCPHGLYRVRGEEATRLRTRDGLCDDRVNALRLGADGRVWAGTRGGVNVLSHGRVVGRLTEREGLPASDVSALFEDRSGSVWIGTTSAGLCRLGRGRLDALERFPPEAGLPSEAVTAFFEDREGSLWVGTKGGLCRFKSGSFVPLGIPEGLPHNKATSLVEGRDGSLWIWTDGGGLSRWRDGRLQTLTTRDGLASLYGGPLYEDREGAIWIGHDRGLSRVQNGRVQAFRMGALGRTYVSAIIDDDEAPGLLVFLVGAGLHRLQGGRLLPHPLTDHPEVKISNPFSLHRARDGTLWMATARGLLAVKQGVVRFVWRVPDEMSVAVSIHEDAEGTLWVGTWRGLVRVAGQQVTRFSRREGLFQERIYHVLEDAAGYLWLASPRGIFRVRKAELGDVANGRATVVRSDVFGASDGMRSPEAISDAQPAGCSTRDGRLWFATSAGVVSVDPAHLTRNTLPPPVVIEGLVAGEERLAPAPALRVAPGVDRLEIHYNGLSLLAPERVRFRYQLAGLDETWVEAGTRREAYFTRLAPGDYTFRVVACNNDGVWNERGAALRFHVAPRWYQRTLFRVVFVALVVAALAGLVRLRARQARTRELELEARVAERTRALERETHDHRATAEQLVIALRSVDEERRRVEAINEAQNRLFANISHDLRTPLTLILAPVEALLGETPPGSLRDTLTGVRQNSLRLARYIDEFLDLARLDAGVLRLSVAPLDLRALARSVYELSLPLAVTRGIEFRLDAPASTTGFFGDAHRIDSILTNLVGNALKFTPSAGHVTIRIREREDAATVEVEDDGRGIPETELPRVFDRFFQGDGPSTGVIGGVGLGLALAHELAEAHGGRLSVESAAGRGTTFALWLPKGSAHFRPELLERRREPSPTAGNDGRVVVPTGPPRQVGAEERLAPLAEGQARVLVVEDGEEMRAFLGQLLAPLYEVLEACDGEEGLASVRNDHPDLVISDVMMPERSGTDLCRLIKADPRLRTVPVILLTARTGSEATLEAYAHGADDFVAKPFHPQVLLARVDAQLRLRRLSLRLIAQEKLAAVGTLAAGVAHEVRNPLNALVNAARVLHQGQPDPTLVDELLSIIIEASRRIEEIVAALDVHARPAEPAGVAPCDVAAGIDATFALLKHRLGGIEVRRIFHTRRRAIAHAGRLNQVLMNLADNALRAGATIVTTAVDEEGAWLRVRLSDNGPGVPKDVVERIFDAFFTTRPPGEGTGLGLYLSRRLIVEMGGELRHVAEAQGGATFEIVLPAEPQASTTPAADGSAQPGMA